MRARDVRMCVECEAGLRVRVWSDAGGLVRARGARSTRIGFLQKRGFQGGKGRVQGITQKFVGRVGKGDACLNVLAPVGGYRIRELPRSFLTVRSSNEVEVSTS